LPDLDVLDAKAISHSLASFSFSKDTFTFDDTTFFRDDTRHDDFDAVDDDNEPFAMEPMDIDGGASGGEDFFTGDQAVNEDYNGDMPLPDNDNDYGGGGGEGDGEQPVPGHAFVPFDPRQAPNERDLVMAMTGDGDGEDGGGMMDYFDQNFLKNWAGPEHWKLRKVVRRREFTSPTTFIGCILIFGFVL
jgi:condensin complex subunit 2